MNQLVPISEDVAFTIDDEFKSVLPPLDDEERAGLEKMLLAEGCRDPLVVWNGLLIDGHNRYEICQSHGLPYRVIEKSFPDRASVRVWMRQNQGSKRNLTPAWKIELALANKEDLKATGAAKKSDSGKETGRGNRKVLSQNDKTFKPEREEKPHNTRKEIADKAGVSTGQVGMAEQVRKKDPALWEKTKQGETSISAAYKDIQKREKKEQHKADIQRQRDDIEKGEAKLPEGVYEVVVMDPPWNYGREYDPAGSRVANPYPEMTQAELLAMEPPFADDCAFFLWTTHQFIWDAKALLDRWGFTYKATLVWDKEKIGMGAWLRMQCEFCLVGIKGKPVWENSSWRDIIREPRREHSRKPEAFYQMVEEITVGRRLDYFSRGERAGWEAFGNDTARF